MPVSPARRLIAPLDLDAFYASVELLRYPDLRGRAVVIGGGRDRQPVTLADGSRRYATLREYTGRGVITTSTYEARALGVHSGMGVMKAAALAPEAVLLPVDFDAYRQCSRRFKEAVRCIAPLVEDRGIDEIYIDLSDLPGAQVDGGRALALALKAAVFDATGLRCSIAVAPNKLLAKIGSELDKPDGLTLLDDADIVTRIWPLAARKVNGIGPKAATRLCEMGIDTIGQLAAAEPATLIDAFGRSMGAWLHDAAHGRCERPVVTHREPKSISRETTFERDLHAVRDRTALGEVFTRLCERLADDLRRKGVAGRTIGIKLRYDDFRSVTRDLTLPNAVVDAADLRHAAGLCLKRVDLTRRLRLLGVRASTLQPLATLTGDQQAAEAPSSPMPVAITNPRRRQRATASISQVELPLFD